MGTKKSTNKHSSDNNPSSNGSQFLKDIAEHLGNKRESLLCKKPFGLNAHSNLITLVEYVQLARDIAKWMKVYGVKQFQFICGKGNHSQDKPDKIKEKLEIMFQFHQYCEIVKQNNGGVILIRLK